MKEIKIINYVFKYKNKLNLISVEEYYNYENENAKIKLILNDQFYEKNIRTINRTKDKIVFDDLIITRSEVEICFDEYHIKLMVDNNLLLSEYEKVGKNKNNYILFEQSTYTGIINEEEVSDKLFIDYESLVNICDDYHKIYCIDFMEFSGRFSMISLDFRSPNILLRYKDEEFKNKKPSNVRRVIFFKLSNHKFIVSGNYYWKVKLKINKTFKSKPATIPFKYQKGIIYLKMKKNLFKTNLKASSNEMLFISYKYI